jgi:hypothetical protein
VANYFRALGNEELPVSKHVCDGLGLDSVAGFDLLAINRLRQFGGNQTCPRK